MVELLSFLLLAFDVLLRPCALNASLHLLPEAGAMQE
jgi:hypothetical protein